MNPAMRKQGVVFWLSTMVIVGFVLAGLVSIAATERVLQTTNAFIMAHLSWLFVVGMAVFLLVVLWAGLGKYGHIRLGPDDSRPEFSTLSWFAMLLSAGVAIGLFFFGVAEPIMHYNAPPFGEGGTPQAASRAMGLSFFHWGFHAWGCCCCGSGVVAPPQRRRGAFWDGRRCCRLPPLPSIHLYFRLDHTRR